MSRRRVAALRALLCFAALSAAAWRVGQLAMAVAAATAGVVLVVILAAVLVEARLGRERRAPRPEPSMLDAATEEAL